MQLDSTFGAALLLGALATAQAPDAGQDDVVLRALQDELARSMARLTVDGGHRPYYGAYVVTESDAVQISASFGALEEKGRERHRSLDVDFRVGDYRLDNTNFSGGGFSFGGFGMGGYGGGSFPLEDDYDAFRHMLWLATDSAYHDAVQTLEKKKAHLEQTRVKDRPDDFARAEPVVALAPLQKLELDRERWGAIVRDVSGVFRSHQEVQRSRVMLLAEAEHRWFVNSEGFRNRRSTVDCGILIVASAQADDGMRVGDFAMFAARSPADLPPSDVLVRAAQEVAANVTRLAKAKEAEPYRGPVLFEGEAAAALVMSALGAHVGNPVKAVGDTSEHNPFEGRLGKRVMPEFLTVIDDPTLREFRGQPIIGGFTHDDDGVPAQRITLVENGMLKTFCSSRVPSRLVKESNGHSRHGTGSPGILIVESSNALPKDALRARLRQLGDDEGLDHVLVVRRMSNYMLAGLTGQLGADMFVGGGEVTLMPPFAAAWVSVADGSEKPIRGARFGMTTTRILRDIDASGDDTAAWLSLGGSDFMHVVTPSLLVKEAVLVRPAEEHDKPPVLSNPEFAR
jgi:predicted Zn-dependent protease